MKAARQRGDTAAVRALREQNKPQREAERAQMKKVMDAERADLRAALAPQNQAKFDANAQQVAQRMAQRGGKGLKGGRRAPGATAPRA
jgi:Spy/CpxP family protein refolding chaperone